MEIQLQTRGLERVGKATPTFLVVDDHPLVRHGFALSVGEIHPDARVLEAGSLDEAVTLVRRTPGLTLVLFDLGLGRSDPERSAVERSAGEPVHPGIRRMMDALAGVPLLVISGSDEVADIVDSVRLGARGYILKTSSAEVLEHAISLALSGETFLPLPRAVLNGSVTADTAGPAAGILDRLTDRQRDVFQLLLAGNSNKEIARGLGVLEGTVKVHVRAIMQKLGVRNRTQVAVVAARSGCFPEDA
ncbi:LuxR C-terminal-related transcriptional regulator [Azospirillum doebereinerae]|uniref:Response regulator transcription factor n=1 Tax=Azospirillum doebereinerae TaxID=92933 RepID=A0A433JEV6_9PROT|nr:response regulator transcription factor [Azospirillum doebereinerae]MCG5239104.1 response regulator transcription factor [Azospirillum doebereinerae]RUQ75699.1 response regulator transcription factor [Azospirillum doebereinerae]